MKKTSKTRFGTAGGASILAVALFYASASYGQSLGDVARQERERRKQEPQQAAHVYTNEDLTREQILVPEDRERVLAARRNESAPEIQAQAVDLLSLPSLNVTLPTPEVAIIPISTELQAPPIILIPQMVKIVAKTTRVVFPAQPKIPALPAPALPIVSAKLELAAPQPAVQHREVSEAVAATTVVQAKLSTAREASSSAPVQVLLASVSASTNRAVQHGQRREAISLVHFEKTKPNSAPRFSSNNVLLAEAASHRSVQHRGLEVASPAAVTRAKAPVAANLVAPQAGPSTAAPIRAARSRQRNEAISLVDFERSKSRTSPAGPASNALLAQAGSREVVRHQSEKAVLAPTQVQTQTLEMVRVEHGDSLWKLAKEHLGSGLRWHELAEMNPEISDPRLIRVGDMLRLPNA